MLISDFAIKRPMVTVLAMVALVVFGLLSLARLETDEFPEVSPPFLVVGVLYPGASPDGVERELLNPVEEAIQGISGVDMMQGTALDSYAQVFIQFEFGKNMQEASQQVRDAISAIRQDLPPEMEEPLIRRFSPNDFPIYRLALSSDRLTTAQLTQLADGTLAREFRSIPGVARVDIAGQQNRELSINLRPDALSALGISPAQVVQALQLQNIAAPVGRLNSTGTEQAIRLEGRLRDPQSFLTLPVGTGNEGRTVYLAEVADVVDAAEEPRSLALYNGREAVGIDIVKATDASTTTVTADIEAKIAQVLPTLPAGTRIDEVADSGERVSASVANVVTTLMEGLVLTVLVVFLFLNSWRSTVITGLALPVSMLASFTAVYAAGFTLNTMSLLGLTLAIGIIIDDAIVVRENIVRHVEMGKDHLRASMEGTDEIGLAVAATTFSIVAVFVPIGFIEGLAGQWFKPFALTIAASVLVSLFVSFSLDPMLSAYWPDPHVPEDKKVFITRWLDRFNRWFDRRAQDYRRVVAWALDHPAIIVTWALASLIAAVALPASGWIAALAVCGVAALASVALKRLPHRWFVTFPTILAGLVLMVMVMGAVPGSRKVGSAFFPQDDRGEFQLFVKTPPGSSLDYTRAKLEQIARTARAYPEVRYTYATVASQSGAVDEGGIYVRLIPMDQRAASQDDVTARLRRDIAGIQGVETAVQTGFDGAKQIQLQLRSQDRAALQRAADSLLAIVRTVPGAVDAGLSTRGRRPEVAVDIDRDAALQRGLSVGQIAQSLRPAFAGIDAGDWVDPDGETRDVYVRYAPEYRADAGALQWLPLRVPGPMGVQTVTLGEVAAIREGLGPAIIQHLDGDPVITVEANVREGAALSEVLAGITAKADTDGDAGNGIQLATPGVVLSQGGEAQDQAEVFTSMLLALLSGIMLMYLILVLQFGSFIDPIAILISLPLSLIGVMLGLFVAGSTINLMAMIGVILLMGIVAKNAILLIDFAKEAKASGMNTRDALIEAGGIRLRPILMTTFALVAGMVPIAIGAGEGAGFRSPLGVAVIGGTITSTILTLLVIPTVWELMDKGRDAFVGAIQRRRAKASAHAEAAPSEPAYAMVRGEG
jgi:hydrophobic/amphiphilic exporter-1 (mainly G- bacteria), HAE1 family